jgi:hypothetical protein
LNETGVKGSVWPDVAFNFPKGNVADEKPDQRPFWRAVNCNGGIAVSFIIRRMAQTVLSCCVAGVLAAPACAQSLGGQAGGSPTGASAANPAANAAQPATAAPAPAKAASMPASNDRSKVEPVEFAKLAGFDYLVPDTPDTNQVAGSDTADKQIPADVKALNKKQVSVVGYLLPLKEEKGKASEFLLMRTQSSCCFGIAPGLTEVITVKAAGQGVPAIMDQLVEIQGTLQVGTVREDGYIVGVYRMDDGKFMGRSDR